MNPSARSALTLAVLLVLPQLQALCPRLAPDVISGKVIPCRYLCIKINFLELPSIVLSTERDGVLCSTLLLRRRGVCKNGGCIPFGSDDDIKPKGALGKVIAAIDKFASGSYRQKAPKPGTPFGPIVSTASSIFGGGSSKTSGSSSTSSAASSIVATATVAAVGSTFKKLLSQGASALSEKKPHSEHPFSSIFPSISKPDHHPASAPAGTLSSSSGATPVSFGGGPPVFPPSTEGGTDSGGTPAAPVAPSMSSGHPALPPLISPAEHKPKESLSTGSAPGTSGSNGNVMTHALGLVLGNLHKISGPTSGTSSTSVVPNGPIVEASGGSGTSPTFPFGQAPPIAIAPSSPSSGTKRDGEGIHPGILESANVIKAGHRLSPPGQPAVSNFGYTSKISTIASSSSRPPLIESSAPSAASQAGNSAGSQLNGPYGPAFTRLKEISQGSPGNTFTGQPSFAAFSGTTVPSSNSRVITSPEGASGANVNPNKVTVTNVPGAGATPITVDYGHGRPSVFPLAAKREEAPRWPGPPNTASRPLNNPTQAVGIPTGTLRGTSQLLPSNPVAMKPPLIGSAPFRPSPKYTSGSSSGSLIKTSLTEALTPFNQEPASTAPVIPFMQPLSPNPGETSIPTNNPSMNTSYKRVISPEVNPRKEKAAKPFHGKLTPPLVKPGGSVPPSAAAETKVSQGAQSSAATGIIPGPAVISSDTVQANIDHIGGPSVIFPNKPSDRPSPLVGSSDAGSSAASGSTKTTTSQVESTFGRPLNTIAGLGLSSATKPTGAVSSRIINTFEGALNTLKRASNNVTPTAPLRLPATLPAVETPKPSGSLSIQSIQEGSSTLKMKNKKNTVSGALPGTLKRKNEQLGGGAPTLPSPILAATASSLRTLLNSTAQNSALRPTNRAAAGTEAGVTNAENVSQVSSNKPATGLLYSTKNSALGFPSLSRPASSSEKRMETSGVSLTSSLRISKGSSPPTPTKKILIPLKEKLKQIRLHKAVTVSQRGHTQIEKTVTLRGSASRKPAEVGSNAPNISGSENIDKQPAAPALKPISSTAGMAEPSTSARVPEALSQLSSGILVNAPLPSKATAPVRPPTLRNQGTRESLQRNLPNTSITSFPKQRSSEADAGRLKQTIDSLTKGSHSAAKPGSSARPHLSSSTPVNRPPLSMATAQLQPATSRTPGLLESRQRTPPTPGMTPSDAGSGTTKPAINSLAHGSRSAARTGTTETSLNLIKRPSLLSHAALHNRAPLLAEAELAGKASISKSPSSLKNMLPGELRGTKNALPPGLPRKIANSSNTEFLALPGKSGGTSKLPSLPANRKSISDSGSGALRVRPEKRFFRRVFSRFKHKRKQNNHQSQSTRNEVVKGGVSSPSMDMGSTKPKMVTSLNSSVKGSQLPGPPAAVPPTMPNTLLTPSQRKEHNSLPTRTESRSKSFGVEPTIPQNGTTITLGKTEDALLSKSKSAPRAHNKKSLSENNATPVRSSPHGGVKTSAIDGRNALSTNGGQINLPNHVPPTSELGAASSPIENIRSTTQITSSNPALHNTAVPGNKQSVAVDQHTETKASLIAPSGTGMAERNANNKEGFESANKPHSTTLSTTSRTAEATQNAEQPIGRVPSTLGVGSSGTVTGTKTASPSISSISHGNTAATPSTPITTTGAPSRAYSGNQLAPRQLAVHPTPAIAAASSGSNQGSQTNLPRIPGSIEETKNSVSPSIEVPSLHGSLTSTKVTATKNISPSFPSTLRSNTVSAHLQRTAQSGTPSSAHAGSQLEPKPIAAPQNPASSLATALYSSSQGSQTSGLIENTVNAMGSGGTFNIKSGTSSQRLSSTSRGVESKMSPSRDNLSEARYVSATRSMYSTSRASDKPSATAASLPVSTSTLVSPTLGVQSSPPIATVNAPNGGGGTSAATVATEKHTPTAGSLPSTKGSVSLGPTAHSAPTPAGVSATSGVSLSLSVRNSIPANQTVGTLRSIETSEKHIPTASSTLASATSGASLASLARNVIAANQLAGSLGTKQTIEKPTPTASSLSGVKGSASFGRAEQGAETPSPSPSKPANTITSAHRSATTSGPQIGLVTKSSAGLATPNMETPGINSGSTANVPATPVASTTYSRNSSPKASENEVTKAGKGTTPVSHLSASAPKISVPQNVKVSRSLALTNEKKSFVNVLKSVPRLRSNPIVPKGNIKSVQKSAPRLRSSALDLEVKASNNVKTPGELAGSLQKAGTYSRAIAAPASSLPSGSIVSRSPNKREDDFTRPVKPSSVISSLGSILSKQANAFRSTVQSGGSAVPKLLSKFATSNKESTVTETRGPMVANGATQPAEPSLPAFTAPMNRQSGQITSGEQPSSTLYPGMRQSNGMMYGNPNMPNGFWGPPQGMAGMFRPF